MRIGFYGDSFCSNLYSNAGYETYIKKTVDYYNADLVNLGVGGSSVWDVLLLQFPQNFDDVPDVCIFTWTSPDRLFHRTVRKITHQFYKSDNTDNELKNAVKQYFLHLYDQEKSVMETISAMHFFDNKVLSKVNSKIVHLWSFGNSYGEAAMESAEIGYEFTNGVDTKLNLSNLASLDVKYPNHIHGDENNQLIFEKIKDSINNYK